MLRLFFLFILFSYQLCTSECHLRFHGYKHCVRATVSSIWCKCGCFFPRAAFSRPVPAEAVHSDITRISNGGWYPVFTVTYEGCADGEEDITIMLRNYGKQDDRFIHEDFIILIWKSTRINGWVTHRDIPPTLNKSDLHQRPCKIVMAARVKFAPAAAANKICSSLLFQLMPNRSLIHEPISSLQLLRIWGRGCLEETIKLIRLFLWRFYPLLQVSLIRWQVLTDIFRSFQPASQDTRSVSVTIVSS